MNSLNYHIKLSLGDLDEKCARDGKQRVINTKIEIGAIPPSLNPI